MLIKTFIYNKWIKIIKIKILNNELLFNYLKLSFKI